MVYSKISAFPRGLLAVKGVQKLTRLEKKTQKDK